MLCILINLANVAGLPGVVHIDVAFGLLSWGDLISSDYRQFDFRDTI